MKVTRVFLRWVLIVFAVSGFVGCADSNRFEDYNLAGVSDISLTEVNHPHGYGSRECLYCHVKANIHRKNRVNSPLVDLAKEMVEQSGLSSCSACHGNNGVTP